MGIPSIVSMKLLVQVDPLVALALYATHTCTIMSTILERVYIRFFNYTKFFFLMIIPPQECHYTLLSVDNL